MSYNKLVRDKIPDIIKANGEEPIIKTLSDYEYRIELEKKLKEELIETLDASGTDRIEEMGDMLEVMICLAKLEEHSLNDIISACNEKRKKCGSFNKKIYLNGVRKLQKL